MTKTFPVQLPEELHRRLKHASIDEGISLHDWILKTLDDSVANGTVKKKKIAQNARTTRSSR